jgi:hypothetical protein
MVKVEAKLNYLIILTVIDLDRSSAGTLMYSMMNELTVNIGHGADFDEHYVGVHLMIIGSHYRVLIKYAL